MTKAERKTIWEKTGGKCYYCGKPLEKGWHVDHIAPVLRHPRTGKMHRPELDVNGNKVPSCPRCNIWKHTEPLEGFKLDIQRLITRLNRDFSAYRMAKDFGLVKETEKSVVFYFENKEPQYQSILSDYEKGVLKKVIRFCVDLETNHSEGKALESVMKKLQL